jgi:hypothetical protein
LKQHRECTAARSIESQTAKLHQTCGCGAVWAVFAAIGVSMLFQGESNSFEPDVGQILSLDEIGLDLVQCLLDLKLFGEGERLIALICCQVYKMGILRHHGPHVWYLEFTN